MAYEIARKKLSQLDYFSTEFNESDDDDLTLDNFDSSINNNKTFLSFSNQLLKDSELKNTLLNEDTNDLMNNNHQVQTDNVQQIIDVSDN